MRELVFPSDYSLGELVVYKDWRGEARIIPSAQGAVRLADNERVILAVNQETCDRMERLREIKPNMLHGLSIQELDVKECDLSELSRICELELVGLFRVSVSHTQLSRLSDLTDLKFLHLNAITQIHTLGWMRDLHRLEILNLGLSGIGDDELQTLPTLGIGTLLLYGTRVSDESLAKLASLRSLVSLNISDTGITEEGRARLATLLPNCRIRYGSS